MRMIVTGQQVEGPWASGSGRALALGKALATSMTPILVVALAWELMARGLNLNPNIFPGVERVVETWWYLALSGILWKHVALTLYQILVALIISPIVVVSRVMLMCTSRPV